MTDDPDISKLVRRISHGPGATGPERKSGLFQRLRESSRVFRTFERLFLTTTSILGILALLTAAILVKLGIFTGSPVTLLFAASLLPWALVGYRKLRGDG